MKFELTSDIPAIAGDGSAYSVPGLKFLDYSVDSSRGLIV
jgi:hypothetical protein